MIEICYKNGDVKQFEYKGHYKKVVDKIMQAIEIKKGITYAKLLESKIEKIYLNRELIYQR